jgi:intein/homing endonuclease/ribosomal protein L37AE/L43A
MDINKEMIKCKNYKLIKINNKLDVTDPNYLEYKPFKIKTDGYTFNASTKKEYMKLLAFARLLGMIITDGHMAPNITECSIYAGHEIDAQCIVDDIELITNIRPDIKKKKGCFTINTPLKLSKMLRSIECLPIGKKINAQDTMPFVDDWPLSVLREFLGALFGGNGHAPTLMLERNNRERTTSVEFSKSKFESKIFELKMMMKRLKNLLSKFGINDVTIQKEKETTVSKTKAYKNKHKEKCYEIVLHVPRKYLIKFSEKIGFRYCAHKLMRLTAAVSYEKLRYNTEQQMKYVINETKMLSGYIFGQGCDKKKLSMTKSYKISINKLNKNQPILNKHYSVPSFDMVRSYLKYNNKTENCSFLKKHFPTAEKYLEKINTLSWFLTPDAILKEKKMKKEGINRTQKSMSKLKVAYSIPLSSKGLPTYDLAIVGIKKIKSDDAYDIEIDKHTSYVANGIVVHNCMLSHGMAQFLKEVLLDKSDIYSTYVCDICGLIAQRMLDKDVWYCPACPSTTDMAGKNSIRISKIVIPYACKLLFQELMAMNIAPRIRPKKTLYNTGMY